jgi:hypothetical protein
VRPTEEEKELRSAVPASLARHEGAAAWQPLTEQIGAAGLAVPEEYGGAGRGAREVHVVMEELGRALSPVPYLGSAVLAVQALLASGDARTCVRLLPGLAEGRSVGALAWSESGSWDPAAIRADAARGPGGVWRLTGTKEFVLHEAEADVLLVAVRTEAGISLFHAPVDGVGVRRVATVPMDRTRAQARLVLDGAEARLIGADGDSGRVLRRVRDLACTAASASPGSTIPTATSSGRTARPSCSVRRHSTGSGSPSSWGCHRPGTRPDRNRPAGRQWQVRGSFAEGPLGSSRVSPWIAHGIPVTGTASCQADGGHRRGEHPHRAHRTAKWPRSSPQSRGAVSHCVPAAPPAGLALRPLRESRSIVSGG